MREKKVVAVIVEGPSDEAALGPSIRDFFMSDEVRFIVVHGDITTNGTLTHETIIAKISDLIHTIKIRYRYKNSDFLRIIQICDTDGAFASDSIMEADVGSVRYYTDHVEVRDADALRDRNERKAAVLFKLRTSGRINGIPYKIFYNSCNLEHVLYGKLRHINSREKVRLADDFAEKYDGNLEAFIQFISSPEVAVPGTYRDTWEFIEEENNSLNRHTNIHLIFTDK